MLGRPRDVGAAARQPGRARARAPATISAVSALPPRRLLLEPRRARCCGRLHGPPKAGLSTQLRAGHPEESLAGRAPRRRLLCGSVQNSFRGPVGQGSVSE
eukprot:7106212-Lingulodinium_polyedra.AAC.1